MKNFLMILAGFSVRWFIIYAATWLLLTVYEMRRASGQDHTRLNRFSMIVALIGMAVWFLFHFTFANGLQ